MFERYARQIVLPEIGESGQQKMSTARVAIVGAGALGSAAAEILTRAGVGNISIFDRDLLELSNLQRQFLYTEADVQAGLPKAQALANHLRQINTSVAVTSQVVDVNFRNAMGLLRGHDLILDATDNYLVRLLINDVALDADIPWVYGGALGMTGMVLPIVPGRSPCFRCMVSDIPAVGSVDTCDLVGVLGSVTAIVAAMQSTEAIKLIVSPQVVRKDLIEFNIWTGRFRTMPVPRDPECPACGLGYREFLRGRYGQEAVSLCGRNSVQVLPSQGGFVGFEQLTHKLQRQGEIRFNRFTMRFRPTALPQVELTVFPDGRAIIKGTEDINYALSLYARYLG